MKYTLARFGGRYLSLLAFCLFFCLCGLESQAQGCARDVSYRVDSGTETADVYLTLQEPGETYTLILFATEGGVTEMQRVTGVQFKVGEEKRIFENVAKGHYVIQIINQQGCHFVVNGMKGVSVE